MVKCNICNKEMRKADGCELFNIVFSDGTSLAPIKYGDDFEGLKLPDRCHDCNCKKGHYHHSGCDMELCPKCRKQLISCGCAIGVDD